MRNGGSNPFGICFIQGIPDCHGLRPRNDVVRKWLEAFKEIRKDFFIHSSFLIPHSSFLIPHSSFLIPHYP